MPEEQLTADTAAAPGAPGPQLTPDPGAASLVLGNFLHHTAMLNCCSFLEKPAVPVSAPFTIQAKNTLKPSI